MQPSLIDQIRDGLKAFVQQYEALTTKSLPHLYSTLILHPDPTVCSSCGAAPPYATFNSGRRQCDDCRAFLKAAWFQRKKRNRKFKRRRAAYMRHWRSANREYANAYARRYRLANARPGATTGKIRLLYRVTCGVCTAMTDTYAKRETAAAKIFRDRGWSKTVKHGWICATCVAERSARVR